MKVKVIVATGVAFPDAVKASLGMSLRDFAVKHGVAETTLSAVINGSAQHTYHGIRDILAAELGVERAWLDEQLTAHAALRASTEGVA